MHDTGAPPKRSRRRSGGTPKRGWWGDLKINGIQGKLIDLPVASEMDLHFEITLVKDPVERRYVLRYDPLPIEPRPGWKQRLWKGMK